MFGLGPFLREAVHAAAGGKNKGLYSGFSGGLSQFNAGAVVDFKGHFLEGIPHRVIRDRRQMHDRVDSLQNLGVEFTNVSEVLYVEQALGDYGGPGQAGGKKAHIVSDQADLRKFRFEVSGDHGADIAHVTGD